MRKDLIVLAALMISCSTFTASGFPQSMNSTITVYYFHGTIRCPSCTLLEELIRDAVEFGFGRELETRIITVQAIDIDLPGNEHFVDDYGLNAQSVVLSQIENGRELRWKNLDQIWTLFNDQGALWEYLQNEIQSFLKTAP